MTTEINTTLDAISRNLFAGSSNYCASFKLLKCGQMAGRSLREILAVALGEGVVIGASSAAEAADVLEALKDALAYPGDAGSHPGQDYLKSERFKRDESLALAQVGAFVESASHIVSFSLKEGHPFYPVFWDFAFSIDKDDDAFVFIGSSSD